MNLQAFKDEKLSQAWHEIDCPAHSNNMGREEDCHCSYSFLEATVDELIALVEKEIESVPVSCSVCANTREWCPSCRAINEFRAILIDRIKSVSPELAPRQTWQCGKCQQDAGQYSEGEKLPDHTHHCPKRGNTPQTK